MDIPRETKRKENHLANLVIDEKYGRIDTFTREMQSASIEYGVDTKETKLKQLEVRRTFNKINDDEFEKEFATLTDGPWFSVVKTTIDPNTPTEGLFELDWNEKFVETLKAAGYKGDRPELVVQQWFDNLCKNIAKEHGAVFPEEVRDFDHKTKNRKVRSEDGTKTEIL